MVDTSPYYFAAASLRDMGYHVMPVGPGTKIPGQWRNNHWEPMPGWQKFCDAQPPAFVHDKWEGWPEAGVCVAHGKIIGLDLDTDRADVAKAVGDSVPPANVRRRGQKGWMGYYRPGPGMEDQPGRLRWYDPKDIGPDGEPNRSPVLELMMRGTQSVLPPTVHPGTGKPYVWLTEDTLEDTGADELPVFDGGVLAKLDAAMKAIGLSQTMPRKPGMVQAAARSNESDHEKSWGRSINDRAMEPDALDRWWPALNLPKTRQRSPGSWVAVPSWRASGSGRAVHDRNPNLTAIPSGIVDWGDDSGYTPINLLEKALDLDVRQAAEWLEQYIRPEETGMSAADILSVIEAETELAPEEKNEPESPASEDLPLDGSALSRMLSRGSGDRAKPRPVVPTSDAHFSAAFPSEVPTFPVQDMERDLSGALREVSLYIDEASNMRSEQGSFGAALAMLGTIMGRKIEVAETGLRTNLYIVGTAESGAGKSSAMGAMSGAFEKCGVSDRLAGSDFTSGAAILKEMGDRAPKLFSIDEFGDVMHRAMNPKAASHERDIGRIMKDMYSSAAGMYRGKAYASQDRQDIQEPHLCIYGVSTHEAFWEGLDGRAFSDGLLARFLMIPIGSTETQTPRHDRLPVVTDMITSICDMARASGNMSGHVDATQGVSFGPGIWDRWLADRALFQRHARRAEMRKMPGAPSAIQRICENGMKVAMISATGRNPSGPMIDDADYDLGISVAHWSSIYMISAIDRYYVENTSHRDLNRVMEVIDGAGSKGMTRTNLVLKLRGVFVNAMASKSIIDTMKDAGMIVEWSEKTAGAPRKWYVSKANAKEFLKEKE